MPDGVMWEQPWPKVGGPRYQQGPDLGEGLGWTLRLPKLPLKLGNGLLDTAHTHAVATPEPETDPVTVTKN